MGGFGAQRVGREPVMNLQEEGLWNGDFVRTESKNSEILTAGSSWRYGWDRGCIWALPLVVIRKNWSDRRKTNISVYTIKCILCRLPFNQTLCFSG